MQNIDHLYSGETTIRRRKNEVRFELNLVCEDCIFIIHPLFIQDEEKAACGSSPVSSGFFYGGKCTIEKCKFGLFSLIFLSLYWY